MFIYMTTGTYDYLKKIEQKYPQEKMVTMGNEDGALLLHETNGETVFKQPRRYEIFDSAGTIGKPSFVVMNNIPITHEGRPLFEYQFKNRPKQIENAPGFYAIWGLRPLSSNPYIIMSVWENETDFENWHNSNPSYAKMISPEIGGDPQEKVFSSPVYVRKYVVPN